MSYFLGIGFPLFVTLAVETPLVLWILNRYDPSFASFVVAVNTATNLALTTLTYFVLRPYTLYNARVLFFAEVIIALIEAALYSLYTKKTGYAFLASFCANICSFIVGGILELMSGGNDAVISLNLTLLFFVSLVVFIVEVTLYCLFHAQHAKRAGKPSPSQR
jgi:hypothetical protein